MKMKNSSLRLTQAAMIAALAYIGFQFLRIDIPVGPERTAFHLGNTFVVLGALMLGGGWGGAAGVWVILDPDNNVALVYTQHMLNNQEPFISPRLRNILYACL
jgi:hypothetical protein